MDVTLVPISQIETNDGQVKGLPRNPRFIRDERYDKLKQSIADAPEMLEMRSLIAVQHGKKVVAICGNMRLRACRELGYTELPCYILPQDTPAEKLREYTIKDNIGYGQTDWDIVANEWDTVELDNWGMTINGWGIDEITNFDEDNEDDEDDDEDDGLMVDAGKMATGLMKIRVGKYKISVSDETLERLSNWIKEYIQRYGSTIGFFDNILEICNK